MCVSHTNQWKVYFPSNIFLLVFTFFNLKFKEIDEWVVVDSGGIL